MVTFKLSAVIPVAQYSNIQPEFEVEAETYEQAMSIAEGYLKPFWNKYVEAGKELKTGQFKRIKAFVGGEIDYDELNHVYSWNGAVYQSGSQYGETFKNPFDGQMIAKKMAEKVNVNPEDILKMWKLKGDASRDFGNAMHKALQLHEQYKSLSQSLGKAYHIHNNFVLKDIVESFYSSRGEEKAMSEITVVDHATQRAGCIDRLVILGDKHGRVEDFKSGEITKNLLPYQKQLEFYTNIMVTGGWKMEKPLIHGWDGKWETHK